MKQSINKSKRGNAGFFVSVIVFILSYFVARGALEQEMLTVWRVTFALLLILPFVYFLYRFMHNIRSMDEMERRRNFKALAIAFPLVLVLVMILGLLELAIPLNPQDWSYRHVWYLLVLFYFAGLVFAPKRYA